jgi:hypothetical protein
VEKAKKGDIQAAKLILTYAVGNPTVNVRNAVIVPGGSQARTDAGLAPLPPARTEALPGTEDKFAVLTRRARNGQPLHINGDGERDAS